MQTLNVEQVDLVSGGIATATLVLGVAVAIGAAVSFMYGVGQDLAERDNRLECKPPKQN
jgi:hypothetical protein